MEEVDEASYTAVGAGSGSGDGRLAGAGGAARLIVGV